MPIYKYKVLSKEGTLVKGKMLASTTIELEQKLKGAGYELVSYSKNQDWIGNFIAKISQQDLINLCSQLHQFTSAGISILDSIQDLSQTCDNPALKSILIDIYESLQQGSLLSEAFAKYPKIFDHVFVGLIHTGEKTGNLSEVFYHLSKHLEWVKAMHDNIKKATYYPAFVLVLIIGNIVSLMIFLVPQMKNFLYSQGFKIPGYTQVLLNLSDTLSNNITSIIVTTLIIIALLILLPRFSSKIAFIFDNIKLNIPVLGNTIRKFEIARFCRFLSVTYKSGIGILECFDVASQIVQNKVLHRSILLTRQKIAEGTSITKSLEMSNQFPIIVLRMIKTGEASGNLDSSLEYINTLYDKEVQDAVNRLIGMIQPTLTLIMGILILWITISMFGPIYNNLSKIAG